MKIKSIQTRSLRIPLNFRFQQSNNSGTVQSLSAIIELHTREGISGYGESCPRTYVTGESMADVSNDVIKLRSEILENPIDSIEELNIRLQAWKSRGIGPSTRCAFELAWLDAWSRTGKRSLAGLLGLSFRGTLQYSLILPLLSVPTLEKLLPQLQKMEPPAIKLKVNTDLEDIKTKLRVLRSFFGEETPIRLDVNGAWNLEQAKVFIPAMLAVGVHSFEQIGPPEDLESMRELTRLFGQDARIMADETLLDLAGAERLVRDRICNHFNLKISKLGGLYSCLEIYRLAEEHGIPCQMGAHFGETSLLTSAAALLAGMVNGGFSACEGALGELLLSEDITQPSIQHAPGGRLDLSALWQQPGLAGTVLPERLERFTIK